MHAYALGRSWFGRFRVVFKYRRAECQVMCFGLAAPVAMTYHTVEGVSGFAEKVTYYHHEPHASDLVQFEWTCFQVLYENIATCTSRQSPARGACVRVFVRLLACACSRGWHHIEG